MAVLEVIVEKVAPSLVSGLSGAALWGWRTYSKVVTNLRDLHEQVRAVKSAVADLQARDTKRTELEQSARRLQTSLVQRCKALEKRMSNVEESTASNRTALIEHAQEQSDQWNATLRTIGYLEGVIQGEPTKARKP